MVTFNAVLRPQSRFGAEFDLFPLWSLRVRRFVYSPLGILTIGCFVSVLCGLAIHPRVFALAGGLAGVIVVGICWPWLTLRGVRATLRFERERTSEGTSTPAAIELTNVLPWPAWGMRLTGGIEGCEAGSVRLESAPSRSRSTGRWTFAPVVRGVYPLALPQLSTGFPFGIWQPAKAVAVARALIVWPRTYPVGPMPTFDGDEVNEGSVARPRVGSMGDVHGVRPYRRGDSPRRIHWAQSAKHDRLIVCELATAKRPVVVIVLDTDDANHTPGIDGTREWAIRIVASLAVGWLEAGVPLGLVAGREAIPPASGAPQQTRIMDRLAALVPRDSIPLAQSLAHPLVSRTPARLVVTTDAGASVITNRERYVVLRREGFGGVRTNQPAAMTPWLDIAQAEVAPHHLRRGWAEARHGS